MAELRKSEYRRAVEAAAAEEITAIRARYDRHRERIIVELSNGVAVAFPPGVAEGLRGAAPQGLSRIEITPAGTGLHFPDLDADLSVAGLAAGVFGTRRWMSSLARHAGSVRSRAKAKAARANGRLGGRPRKSHLQ